MSIYVETFIDTPLDRVWEHSQRPDLHQQRDLPWGSGYWKCVPMNDGSRFFR